ncbi:MAG: gliding motility-associated C-terminal domain-containing protein [Bacteroidales bacterium]|nr:gliding motility-associated C-terminal domain-containing protein [Bacteroidales bacterium]MCF8404265.1 gliding motility-associated C-terminal domain-containing protein [Bacteroidales bacterium]
MIKLAVKTLLFFIFVFSSVGLIGQYFPNPSFEGFPQPHIPPDGWEICTAGWSTPDVQPGNFGVYLPASDQSTYLGMTAREDYTWEDVHAVLNTPFSPDSCYTFNIDLAFIETVNFITMEPITLKIYGGDEACMKENLLWQSPAITNEDWLTYDFELHPTFEITDVVLEVAYLNYPPAYWGYLLMDNIVITTSPNVDLGLDTTLTLCQDDSLLLYPGPYISYLWSDGSTDSSLLIDTTGIYWVQVFNEYGCSATDSIEVIVEEYIEMESEMIDSTLVCQGQEIELYVEVINGAVPYTYYWQGLEDTLASVTIIADSTSFYYVLITDNCGNTLLDSVKLITLPAPEIDLGDNLIICEGDTAQISAGPGYSGYLWQNGSTDSLMIIEDPGWYWVTVTGVAGCTTTDSLWVEFYPPVPLDLGNDTLMCEFSSLTLNAGFGFENYLWQDGSTQPTYLVEATGIYWVTVTDENGCQGTDSIQVGISPAVNISLGPDTAVCNGETFNLSPGNGFASYLWQDGSDQANYTVTNAGTYWVMVTDINGCNGSDTVSIGIKPSPQFDLGPDTVVCEGVPFVLEPGQFASYLWQDNSTLAFYSVTISGTYSVTVTNNFNCASEDEVFVEVSNAEVNFINDTLICEGEEIILDAGSSNVSYLWQDNSIQQYFSVDTSGLYYVSVINEYGCEGYGEIGIIWQPLPVADLGGDQALCLGDTLVLSSVEGPYNYKWNGEIGNYFLEVTQGGTYELEVSNLCGGKLDQIYIEEFERRLINIGPDKVLLPGESIQLDAGDGFDSYVWQDGSANRYFTVNAESIDPEDPVYFVEAIEGPCISNDTAIIKLFKIKIPIAITPNGDGYNDIFRPFEDGWSGVSRHHITIFNRWGEKVWESDDFEKGWDGKRNGNYVAEGMYYWVLEVYYGPENIEQVINGTLTILGEN